MTDRARPILLALANGNGIGHAMRSGFANRTVSVSNNIFYFFVLSLGT